MPFILSIETSTTVCSVALHNGVELLVSEEIRIPQTQATQLALMIDSVLKRANVDRTALNAVAVTAGPGSYTGLRIGTSTAKGLCFALGIPLIAIDTLTVMARQINKYNPRKALLCPMIDARRMEVYCLVVGSDGKIVAPVEAKIIDAYSFLEFTNQPIIFFGSGAMKCANTIKHADAVFLSDVHPSAVTLGEMAAEKFRINEFEDLALFEPFYLKEFMIKKPATS
ncbi:tRNA (adenosine(37)-N6)-threonylcarbamoyltransferase complex dimerization subunit type 1 TsaB [Pseudochryseolinea flava]|uniref:tRNA (Adenosine(37)-N6)-threonylcarbamoyltransferase complex dimerization subunit type 1 TsaB n=1 Tax=Pseudochryseolinea flava TaxID=2059302 RepID=A0A364XZC0_9BACT|nr:tRNA (adenosine(37)-N6)-threonylcarbamoyltransferase complex dimerization subunit type 1 TsaB [Pseudochryseolinea flava]RAV99734.1 tRNA (adenosine(37)-N6)-threonylcarbamoyltransferase complex dimerization subunit type 1 TsaB [Pseudochryseolinea flava]